MPGTRTVPLNHMNPNSNIHMMPGKTLFIHMAVRSLCTALFTCSLAFSLNAQDCYTITNANNGQGDTGLNGYYEYAGTQYGCQKFIKVGELNGQPSSATYGVERMYGYFWSLVRKSDNVMRYMKVTSNCTIPNSGYTPCCNQGGDPQFTLIGENSCVEFVLPVELSAFNAQKLSDRILLHWQTETETNNDGFEIQRSADGKHWETLDFVPGYGTTLIARSYSWEDQRPLDGIAYYRLRQRDFDGSVEYSKILSVSNGTVSQPFSFHPNPASSSLTVSIPDAEGTVFITDLAGRVLRQMPVTASSLRIDLDELPSGIYLIGLRDHYGWVHQDKLIVSK